MKNLMLTRELNDQLRLQNLTKKDSVSELDVNYYNASGRTVLHAAAEKGNDVRLRRILLSLGRNKRFLRLMLDAPIRRQRKLTALHLAAINNRVRAVDILLDYKAQVNVRDVNSEGRANWTPLHYAAEKGHLEVVRLLIEKGKAEIDAPDRTKGTPLQRAVRFGQLRVVKYLVGAGADVNSRDHTSTSVLSYAAKTGSLNTVHYLVEKGADINAVNRNGVTPLHSAVNSRIWGIMKYLVTRGADLNVNGIGSKTVLTKLVKAGQWFLARLLIENGAMTEGLTAKQTSEFFRRNSISWEGEEDAIFDLIVLGNAEFLKNHINQLLVKSNSFCFLNEVLPKVYEKIQLFNIPITQSVSVLIETQIIERRLFSDRKTNETNNNNNYLSGNENDVELIEERIHWVIEAITKLKSIRFSTSSVEVRDTFLFLLKFITQNVQILNEQLRSSPHRLPWIKMQFCLINFISVHAYAEPKNIGIDLISTFVLNRARLMKHMEHFEIELQKLEKSDELGDKSRINQKIDSEFTSGFKDLCEDYELLRNICSLNRILSYLTPACVVDLKEGDVSVGKQVILRALQVTGECLKNTIESPNMSDKVHHLLDTHAPKNVIKIVTSLRDSLSHLRKGKDAENQRSMLADHLKFWRAFLIDIQKDLQKLKRAITYILYLKRNEVLETFFRRICECQSPKEAKEIVSGVQCEYLKGVEAVDLNGEPNEIFNKVEELIKKFEREIEKTSNLKEIDFGKLDDNVEELRLRFVNISERQKDAMAHVIELINLIGQDKPIGLIRKKATVINTALKCAPENYVNYYQEIITNVHVIYRSLEVRSRSNVKELLSKISRVIEIEAKTVKGINILRMHFDDKSEKAVEIEEYVTNVLENISGQIPDDEIKEQFLSAIEVKKEVFRSKNKLIKYYRKLIEIYNNIIYFYDNFEGIYEGVINFLSLVRDFYNQKKANLTAEENKLIKLIEENKLNELFSELNVNNNLINETAFKIFIENSKTGNLRENNFDVVFSDLLAKLIDKNLFNKTLLRKFREEKNKRQRIIKDEAKVASLIDKIELNSLIAEIRKDLSLDENNVGIFINNVPSIFRKGVTLDVVFGDFGLSKCKSNLQSLQRMDGKIISFGKLVNDVSKVSDVSTLKKAFNEFINTCNNYYCAPMSCSQEITRAIETVFEKIKKDEIIRLQNYFFENFKVLSKVFPNEKSDLELLTLLKTDDNIRLAAEMLVLTLIETLNELSLLEPNRLYSDELSPVLVGKNLRNYLAHGDPLINILPTNYHISLITHFRLFQREFHAKGEFYPRKQLIGKVMKPNLQQVERYYQNSLDILAEKKELFEKSTNNDVEDLIHLVNKPWHFKLRCTLGSTLLHSSALTDNLSVFRLLYQLDLVSVFLKNKNDHSAIYTAISAGSERIIEFLLLDIGFDPSSIVGDGETLLHLAAEFGQLRIVKLLLKYGADIEALDNHGFSPIMTAVLVGHENIFVELLNAGSDIESRDNDGRTLLHLATRNVNIFETLLARKVDVNALDHDLNTPLHLACENGEEAIVKILLDSKANVDNQNRNDVAALIYSALGGHAQIVELLLLKYKAVESDVAAPHKTTALISACLSGHCDVVQLMLKNDPNLIARQCKGLTALHAAAFMGHVRLVDILLNTGVFQKLMEKDATAIFLKGSSFRSSVLHLSSRSGNAKIMELVLAKEISLGKSELLNMIDGNGQTGLHSAIEANQLNAVNFLIEKRANLEAKDVSGRTPIFIAALRGHADIFFVLLNKRVEVNVKDAYGQSLIHAAVWNNSLDIVTALIKRKMNVNARRNDGATALHLVAQTGHLEMVKLLVRNGAVIALTDSEGHTALDIAISHGNFDIHFYLKRK